MRVTVAEDGFNLERGGWLPSAAVAVESWGAPGNPAVLVCHALTGDAHVARHRPEDPAGWWEWLVGPGRPLDTNQFYILAINVLGGCAGSTGPSVGGRPTDFPAVTVGDIVRAEALVLDKLGVDRVELVVGGSLGGMQALEWAAAFPDRVGLVAGIGVSAGLSALALGVNHVQLAALEWGLAHGASAAEAALGWARMLAMLSYRSAGHLQSRFGRLRDAAEGFAVDAYLERHADKIRARFSPASYRLLADAMGRWQLDLDRYAQAAAPPPVRLLGLERDWLFPPAAVRETASRLQAAGVDATYEELANDVGHDAFLMPVPALDAWMAHVAAEVLNRVAGAAPPKRAAPWS